MNPHTILILSYIVFTWLLILHTFEEISANIMETQMGHIKMTRKKYLLAASTISTINLGTLALLAAGLQAGYYLGLFTTTVLGMFQAIVHIFGYFRQNRSARGLGAGVFSSIPLAAVALWVFIQLINDITFF